MKNALAATAALCVPDRKDDSQPDPRAEIQQARQQQSIGEVEQELGDRRAGAEQRRRRQDGQHTAAPSAEPVARPFSPLQEEVRFASDSAVEGVGFELQVPRG
jgi:hypothetical protein